MKKVLSIICICTLFTAMGGISPYAKERGITVLYDSEKIEFDVEPEIINDRVMVPMRKIFEAFGAKVKWDNDLKKVTAKKKSKTMEMTIGNTEMTKNDEVFSFDTAPIISDSRTLVPIRAISEMLGLGVEWEETDRTVVITTPKDDKNEEWKNNKGAVDLDEMSSIGEGIEIDENKVTFKKGGDFDIIGTLKNGQIVVDTEDEIKLRLSSVRITNETGSAIYIKNADKVHITLTEGTDNILTDGKSYTSGDEKEKACITSRDSIEFKGNGSLVINANYNHGIDSSDSMEIENGNIMINAKNDGIHVNDTLKISGGSLKITSERDAIQSEEIIDITGGVIDITTKGDIPVKEERGFGRFPMGEMKDPREMTEEERTKMREEMQKMFEEMQKEEKEEDNNEDVTSKGIKADWLIDISGGDISVNSTDHAIHCASDININGGNINLSSNARKGISAHGDIVINDGNIDITKSTEGIETKRIMTINGGNINIVASDDGINAGGGSMNGFGGGMRPPMDGNDGSFGRPNDDFVGGFEGMLPPGDFVGGMVPPNEQERFDMSNDRNGDIKNRKEPRQDFGGMPPMGFGGNSTEISKEHHIQINGGNIYVNANNDGIDANGSLVIEGGNILVEGPPVSFGGELGLDTDLAMIINGGEVLATGSAVRDINTNQNSVNINMEIGENALFEIKDTKGNILTSYTTKRYFSAILYSSAKLNIGEEYEIYVDGEMREKFVAENMITTVGTSENRMRGGFRRQDMDAERNLNV